MLTIVMYHYVRDLPRTRFPRIKGLLTDHFEGQLDYLQRHYSVCGFAQVLAAMRGGEALPPNPCLLTFDDGFLDHYTTVFPRLQARGLVGSFFPPVKPVVDHYVLDVHKIHYTMAALEDPRPLTAEIFALLDPFRAEHQIPTNESLYKANAIASRHDPAEIAFIKRVLQRGLPQPVRSAIVDVLFKRHVTEDESTFAAELYLDIEQLRCMAQSGMEIGGHGDTHRWLETLSSVEQEAEVRQTRRFLATVLGKPAIDWVMCYPYGSYNKDTLEILSREEAAFGLTTKVGLVTDLTRPLELDRLDTADLPTVANANLGVGTNTPDDTEIEGS